MQPYQGIRFYDVSSSPPKQQKTVSDRQRDIAYLRNFPFNEVSYLRLVEGEIAKGFVSGIPTIIDTNTYDQFLREDRRMVERRLILTELDSTEFQHEDEEVKMLFEAFEKEGAVCFESMIQVPACLLLVMQYAPYFHAFMNNMKALSDSEGHLQHLEVFCRDYGDEIRRRAPIVLKALVDNNLPVTMYVFTERNIITGDDLFAACVEHRNLRCMKTLLDEEDASRLHIVKHNYIYNGDRSTYPFLLLASDQTRNTRDERLFYMELFDQLNARRDLDVLYLDNTLQNCLHKAIIASNLEFARHVLGKTGAKCRHLCRQRDVSRKLPLHYLLEKVERYPFKEDKAFTDRMKAEEAAQKTEQGKEEVRYKMKERRDKEKREMKLAIVDIINLYDLKEGDNPDPEGIYASLHEKYIYSDDGDMDETLGYVFLGKSVGADPSSMGFGTRRNISPRNGPPSFEDD